MIPFRISLRGKLLLGSLAIQALALGALTLNSQWVVSHILLDQTRERVESTRPLLRAALLAPLLQGDYATLNEILAESVAAKRLDYLVLHDSNGFRVAAAGWPDDQPLPDSTPWPPRMTDSRIDLDVPITVGQRNLGLLRLGLSTQHQEAARRMLSRQGMTIALLGLAAAGVLLLLLNLWLMRRLDQLARAAERLGRGELGIRLAELGHDEIGRLTRAFNGMAANLASRDAELRATLAELRASENAQRASAQQAHQERARLNALLSAMDTGILFLDAAGRVVYANPAFARLWRLPVGAQVVGASLPELRRLARHLPPPPEEVDPSSPGEREIGLDNGDILAEANLLVRDEEERVVGRLLLYQDVTQARHATRQLTFLAERDGLTGLYNRRHFEHELARVLAEVDRHGGRCALLYFDLDGFKAINDRYGHAAGDQVLIRVAETANGLVRRNEILCRLGGDEFAVILPNASAGHALQLAERVVRGIQAIESPPGGASLTLEASLGIALYPDHAHDLGTLVAHADAAMYQAKQSGGGAWRLYAPAPLPLLASG